MALIRRCTALRSCAVIDPTPAAKHPLRAIARRWLGLDAEITGDHPAPAEPRRPPPGQLRPLPGRHRPASTTNPPRPTTNAGRPRADQGRDHPLSQALVTPRDLESPPTAPPSQAAPPSRCLTAIGTSTPWPNR